MQENQVLYYVSTGEISKRVVIERDGEYLLNSKSQPFYGFQLEDKANSIPFSCNITIEILPEYPGALIFDGVDDYGVCENMPEGLTDFTVIIKRTMFKLRVDNQNPIGWWNNELSPVDNFCVEILRESQAFYRSRGSQTGISKSEVPQDISIMTPNFYNNYPVIPKDKISGSKVCIGYQASNMAFYSAYLFDRSLGEGEIERFIRTWIDPSYRVPGLAEKKKLSLDQSKLGDNRLT